MDLLDEIDYWVEEAENDLHCFGTEERKNSVKALFTILVQQGNTYCHIPEGRKGIMAYCVTPDFRGGMTVNELFMYIKPEYRGSLKLFKELINEIERFAKENGYPSVRIASNIGYNDQKVLRVLKLFGYETDVVVKYLKEE